LAVVILPRLVSAHASDGARADAVDLGSGVRLPLRNRSGRVLRNVFTGERVTTDADLMPGPLLSRLPVALLLSED
jgi:hypothetical protein